MSSSVKRFVFIFAAVFWGLIQAPLTAYGSSDTSWELTKAFGEAISDQEASNQSYLVLFLVVAVIALGAITRWYILQRSHQRTNEARFRVWLDNSSSSDKTQRAWMRLSFNQALLFSKDDKDPFLKGTIVNMSASGLLFATNQDIQVNDKLKLLLELNPGKMLNLAGKVVRIVEPTHDMGESNLIGVEFINIKRGDQDSIVRKILEKQASTMSGKSQP